MKLFWQQCSAQSTMDSNAASSDALTSRQSDSGTHCDCWSEMVAIQTTVRYPSTNNKYTPHTRHRPVSWLLSVGFSDPHPAGHRAPCPSCASPSRRCRCGTVSQGCWQTGPAADEHTAMLCELQKICKIVADASSTAVFAAFKQPCTSMQQVRAAHTRSRRGSGSTTSSMVLKVLSLSSLPATTSEQPLQEGIQGPFWCFSQAAEHMPHLLQLFQPSWSHPWEVRCAQAGWVQDSRQLPPGSSGLQTEQEGA